MVTLAELRTEAAWDAEFQPPSLALVCQQLRAFYQVGPINIGSKGDERHLRGYHRSARWIKTSGFCTNRTYSVTETPGNRTPGNENWLCAIDMTIPRSQLIPACARLDVAVRAGHLEKITEWYGNDDGDTRVDGYNNITNVVATSDDSHLWHLHLSFDRGRVGEDHDDLYKILTGDNIMSLTDTDIANIKKAILGDGGVQNVLYRVEALLSLRDPVPGTGGEFNMLARRLTGIADQGSTPGGLSETRVREIIREELDRTRLSA